MKAPSPAKLRACLPGWRAADPGTPAHAGAVCAVRAHTRSRSASVSRSDDAPLTCWTMAKPCPKLAQVGPSWPTVTRCWSAWVKHRARLGQRWGQTGQNWTNFGPIRPNLPRIGPKRLKFGQNLANVCQVLPRFVKLPSRRRRVGRLAATTLARLQKRPRRCGKPGCNTVRQRHVCS